MVQTLEAVKGGGVSVKVGTKGTISTLISRELEYTKSTPKVSSSCASISVSSGETETTPRGSKPRLSVDEQSSNSSSNVKSHKVPETTRKTKHYNGRSNQIPMLTSDNISIDGTPIRQKPVKRGTGVVEIVDIKCGNANPIANRLKKLGFSKLSDNIG